MAPGFVFFMGSWVYECVSLCLYVFLVFFFFGPFASVCFVLLCLVFILFYYYSLGDCLFSKERQKGYRLGWREKWGGPWRRENHNQNILHEK